jgi:hypothetical protein
MARRLRPLFCGRRIFGTRRDLGDLLDATILSEKRQLWEKQP